MHILNFKQLGQSITRNLLPMLACIPIVIATGCSGENETTRRLFEVNRWVIDVESVALSTPIRILHISDIHYEGTERGTVVMEELFGRALEESPDLIFLGGDYTGLDGLETKYVRDHIVQHLDRFSGIAPTYAIMGNHEHWTEVDAWYREFKRTSIQIIEGRSEALNIRGQQVCIRGLGDAYTGNDRLVDFSPDCKSINLTITHDPVGVQRAPQGGVYLAGHTHCSQVVLPLIPAFWTPTAAPEQYWCGYGSDGDKQWVTSAGVGTSVLPFRLGTQASIELIEIF